VIGSPATWKIPLPFDPGPHHLTITGGGKPARVVDVVLVEGKTLDLAVGGELTPPAAPALKPAAPAAPPPGPGAGPWILGGIGAASAVVAIATGIVTVQLHAQADAGCSSVTRTCTSAGKSASDQGRIVGPVTTTGIVVGALALTGAGIWAGVGSGKAKARVGIGPVTGGGLGRVEGSW
jgi:hypothetical protein